MNSTLTVPNRWYVILSMLLATGCGASLPAKPAGVKVGGKIALTNGSPLTAGTLVLRPEGGIYGASAQIRNDGSFELVDPEGNQSVVPGNYRVYVRFNNPGQKALQAVVNPRYQDTENGDSDILVNIQESRSDLAIRLNR